MRRVSAFLIAAALIVGMAGCGGDGDNLPPSQNSEIRDWYDLDAIRNRLGGSHLLLNDLDSTTAGYEDLVSPTADGGRGWQPIGGTADKPFVGTLNGQGYEICDLFINRPDEDSVGLFGIVDEGGRIENIGLANADVTGKSAVGGLMGTNNGLVSNSYSTSSVTGAEYVGGVVGYNSGTVSKCHCTGSVTGSESIGGLVGWNYGGTVSNSYSTSTVTGDSWGCGGLVGFNQGTVGNSYSTGSVTGDEAVGGLVGQNYQGTVAHSFWDAAMSGLGESAGGTGKTATEMKTITTFSAAGWNIVAVANAGARNLSYTWNIVDGQTYPFLSWQS